MEIDELFLIKEIENIENKNLESSLEPIKYKKLENNYVVNFTYDWILDLIRLRKIYMSDARFI